MNPQAIELTGFNAHALMRQASKQTRLDDFGDEYFVEPLDHWLKSLSTEADLNAVGSAGVELDIVKHLVTRLRLIDDLKRYPEIGDEDVSDPLAIVGLMRTGTTKLQRMMASSPQLRNLPYWQLAYPAPFPGAPLCTPDDPRLALTKQETDLLVGEYPGLMAAHEFDAEKPEEETVLTVGTFEAPYCWLLWHVPGHELWCRDRPKTPIYEYQKLLLQYLQWQNGGRRGRPTVLKTIATMPSLDAFYEVFPNTTVIHCHRDLTAAMPSLAHLIEELRQIRSNSVDPLALGEEMMAMWSRELELNLDARERLPAGARVLDVQYEDIRDDATGVIRTIFEAHGLQLTEQSKQAMQAWAEDNPQHRLGKHSYSLERYGMSAERLATYFTAYLERFGST